MGDELKVSGRVETLEEEAFKGKSVEDDSTNTPH
jgi:hypothetical protein